MSNTSKAFNPESFVREAYAIAERHDLNGRESLFAEDGIFVDESVKVTYKGRDLDDPVRQSATAVADMHRELYNF
jgi:hypothetical protein